ncbi:hypothetical protein SLEP1_g59878, partial [Rubroshorea leprosula]
IKRTTHKPHSTKRLATASPSSPFEASSTVKARLQTLIDEIIHNPITKDPVDKSPSHEGSDSSSSDVQKSSPKTRGSRSSLWLANKNFKTVNPNEVVDLSPKTKKTTPSTALPHFKLAFQLPRRFAIKSDVIGRAESARKIVADETATLVSKKVKCLSVKHDHETQTKHIQTNQDEIKHFESELSKFHEQLSSHEEYANILSDQRTHAFAELNSHIDHVATLQQTLETLTNSANQAEEELTLMRMEWIKDSIITTSITASQQKWSKCQASTMS